MTGRQARLETTRLLWDVDSILVTYSSGVHEFASRNADDRVARDLVAAARSIDPSAVPVPQAYVVPEWVQVIEEATTSTATQLGAFAHLLIDDDTPAALRDLATRYRDLRLEVLRLTRELEEQGPTARSSDPQESHDAAAVARGAARVPGGPVHKILARLRLLDGWVRGDEVGLTGRELAEGGGSWRVAGEVDIPLTEWEGIPGAWKRCTELARDGLIEQAVEVADGVERRVRRNGSRVWIITDLGLAEAKRLDRLRDRS